MGLTPESMTVIKLEFYCQTNRHEISEKLLKVAFKHSYPSPTVGENKKTYY